MTSILTNLVPFLEQLYKMMWYKNTKVSNVNVILMNFPTFSGKPTRALDTLYEVIKSKKRNHSYSEKLIEQIMFKYLELCVDLKKSHVAKEGLFQYR